MRHLKVLYPSADGGKDPHARLAAIPANCAAYHHDVAHCTDWLYFLCVAKSAGVSSFGKTPPLIICLSFALSSIAFL
jgi:hypothetical protein